MSLLLKLLFSGVGVFRKWPVITGLLIFSFVGMGWSYWQGRSGANERFEKAKTEAILKDTQENIQLSKEAMQIVEKAKDETENIAKTVEAQIETIKNLGPSKYLDVKLSDIGLQ